MSLISGTPRYGILELIAEISLKVGLVCGVAGVATLLMRGFSAYARKMIWVAALAGLFLIPVMSAFTPVWNLSIVPGIGEPSGAYSVENPGAESGKELMVGPEQPARAPSSSAGTATGIGMGSIHWSEALLILWILGVVALSIWFLLTKIVIRRVEHGAVPAEGRLLEETERISSRMGLRRNVRLLLSDRLKAAIAIGVMRPTIILPSRAAAWSDERIRLVLSHELAHVMRHDGWIELFTHVATTIHWFNPLVWVAAKQLRIERERDCDNAVLNSGARPSEYASLLMEIAADLGSAARPAWEVVTISQGSNLKDRLLCILNPSINHSTRSRTSVIIAGILVLTMIIPLSISGIWQTQAQEKQQEKKTEEQHKEQEKLTQEKETYEQEQKMKQQELEKKKKMKGEYSKMSAQEKTDMTWKKIVENGGENSAAVQFGKALKTKGSDHAMDVLKKLKQLEESGESDVYFKESEFNTLGYVFLYHDKVDEAILVFKNNVNMYPDSWNTYDSLGEGLLVAGKYEKSRKYYEKSIAMNPENDNGKKMLAKLEELEKKDVAKKGI
jgi:beta-lactamase regulating signal transducer with metallopeptidase domain